MVFGLISGGVNFTPETDIPDLSGKVIFITGGNSGIGRQTVLELAKHNPSKIYFLARNKENAESAITSIRDIVPAAKITFLPCDLSDLDSVTSCAREFVNREERLDLLILNAGIMATPVALTKQGYEIHFGTNHVAHFLLTKLLLPSLERTAKLPDTDVRIISVSSLAHYAAPCNGIVFSELRTDMDGWLSARRYGQSKLANILFIKQLAKLLGEKGTHIIAASVHPGIINTKLYRSMETGSFITRLMASKKILSMLLTTPEDGAKTQLWAATAERSTVKDATSEPAKGKVVSGEYYTPVGLAGQGSKNSNDEALARKLWEWTEEEVKEYRL